MNVLTTREIKVMNPEELRWEMDQYASIDGRNSVQVAHFQKWANEKKGTKLRVNGKWTRDTRIAYSKFGRTWEGLWKSMYPNYSITSPSGKTRAGYFWDSVKRTWVSAKDSGVLASIGETARQFGIPVPQAMPTTPTTELPNVGEAPMDYSEPEKKGGLLKYALIFAVIGIGGYVVLKKIRG